MIFSHLHFSGTFRWTSDKDYTLVKEVRFLEPYLYKSGSKLAGQKWKEVADKRFTKFMKCHLLTMTVNKRFNRSSLLVYNLNLFFFAPNGSYSIQSTIDKNQTSPARPTVVIQP